MKLLFSTIDVTRQAFYRTSQSYAIVNLKPIVPGHVLVIPTRVVPRLTDLTTSEVSSLFTSVQTVGRLIERAYGGDGLTIACQDGRAAGQSISHVHVHILPRKFKGDRFERSPDDVYPALEQTEAELPRDLRAMVDDGLPTPGGYQPFKVDADENRKQRTMEEMVEEAEWLKTLYDNENGKAS